MKVAVVGAGIAGLVAAHRLEQLGARVVLLEARSAVGGRTRPVPLRCGLAADGGGAYLGPMHSELLALLCELGLGTEPTSHTGASRFHFGAQPVTAAGRFPPLAATALGDLFDKLHGLCEAVPAEQPWRADSADALDAVTAQAWADRHLAHPDARFFFPLFLGEMMAADPRDVSALHMAFYLRSGGGLRYMNAFEGGAQEARVAGGAHRIALRLLERLAGEVRLASEVVAIRQDRAAVRVQVKHHLQDIVADAVVVALPPQLAAGVRFDPPLASPVWSPADASAACIKVHFEYERPLWREHGLSGWSLNAGGPLLSTVDDTPPAAAAGVLTAFVAGARARALSTLTPAQQETRARRHLGELFPELPAPVSVLVSDWVNERYSKGCYAALFGPGSWTARGERLGRPHGRVFWAGTETSRAFFGLMEGAVRSAATAVRQIVESEN